MKYFSLILFAIIVLISCKKEVTEPEAPPLASLGIDPDLQAYITAFETEANARGLSFSEEISLLETQFIDIAEDGVAGQCAWSSHAPNLVSIDIPYWNGAGNFGREFVVFHELGHCVLGRGHDESQDQNGSCLSIMASGTGDCVSRYNAINREYYLDELFSGPAL